MRAEHAMTVVLTTHYMDEADAMAERVVVVDHGRIIADDTADRLKADLAGDRVVVTCAGGRRRCGSPRCAAAAPARDVTVDGRRVEARVADGPRALPVLLAAAQADGVPVETAQVHRPTLDDVFLTLTGRSLREVGAARRPPRKGAPHDRRRPHRTRHADPDVGLRPRRRHRDAPRAAARPARPVLADLRDDPAAGVPRRCSGRCSRARWATAIGGDVWGWFVPAILVMTALFGTSTTGANLLFELQTGAHERMLVTPLPRSSLLVGRALKEMVPLTGQAVVIVVVMLPFGLRVDALGVLAGLVVLAVFGVGLGSLSYALAVAVRKQEWMFWAVQQTLLFPLMILSGMLLPLETGPGVDAGGGRVQPPRARRGGRAGAVRGRVPAPARCWPGCCPRRRRRPSGCSSASA